MKFNVDDEELKRRTARVLEMSEEEYSQDFNAWRRRRWEETEPSFRPDGTFETPESGPAANKPDKGEH
jgi:hypothetical protein